MYKTWQIKRMLERAQRNGLDIPEWMLKENPQDLRAVCNGVGPEHAPKWVRKFITAVARNLQQTAAIHDGDYHKSDGTPQGRRKADFRFLCNGIQESKQHYRWWQPCRWILQAKAVICYLLLEVCGKRAWKDAFNNNQKGANK